MKCVLLSLALLPALTTWTSAVTNSAALFDGRSLAGWQVVPLDGGGKIQIKPGGILEIGAGETLTGLVCTNRPARLNYEINLDARRVSGSDFFCGLTFPVGTNSCTLILGGWGGSVVGLSSLDGADASENETGQTFDFEQNQWYHIRLRVTADKIEAWLDHNQVLNLATEDRHLGMRRGDIEKCMPLGLATWKTTGEIRNLSLCKLPD